MNSSQMRLSNPGSIPPEGKARPLHMFSAIYFAGLYTSDPVVGCENMTLELQSGKLVNFPELYTINSDVATPCFQGQFPFRPHLRSPPSFLSKPNKVVEKG